MNFPRKRLISLILAAVLLVSAIPAVNAYGAVSDWAQNSVSAMDDLGLIPDSMDQMDLRQNITRLDMCRIAVLAYEKVTGETVPQPDTHPFTDTTDPAVEKAYSIGLVAGDGNGSFRPEDPLMRAEFFCIVTTFLRLVDFPVDQQDKADLSRFSDGATLPAWARNQTQVAVTLGVVAGTGTALSWASNTTAEAALAMFYKGYLIGTQPTEPPVTPQPPVNPDTGFIGLSDWAAGFVHDMDDLGLIPDEVRATPMNGSITRTNMCKVIMLAYKSVMGLSDADLGDPGASPFSDTSDRDVLNAYRLGLVAGKGGGIFGADDPITRQDFTAIGAKFLTTVGYEHSDDAAVDLSQYGDAHLIAGYAKAPTRLLISIGALAGDGKNLKPSSAIVCQEALCIFYRIHEFTQNWVMSDGVDHGSEESKRNAAAVVETAKKYLGYDYVYGGTDPETGFDCSGFVYYVYKQFGYQFYPGALNQWEMISTPAPKGALLPGDLVFFSEDGTPDGMTHVGIYIGNGEMIHASTPSTGVILTDLSEPYYVERFLGAKRVFN